MEENSTIVDKLFIYIASMSENTSIIKGIYSTVIVITGFIVLTFLVGSDYPFGLSVLFMSLWLVLIASLDPPPKAVLRSKPFESTGILEDEELF